MPWTDTNTHQEKVTFPRGEFQVPLGDEKNQPLPHAGAAAPSHEPLLWAHDPRAILTWTWSPPWPVRGVRERGRAVYVPILRALYWPSHWAGWLAVVGLIAHRMCEPRKTKGVCQGEEKEERKEEEEKRRKGMQDTLETRRPIKLQHRGGEQLSSKVKAHSLLCFDR